MIRKDLVVLALASASALTGLLAAGSARAAGVPAGTDIENTAVVNYSVGGSAQSISSNTVTVKVAEILDVVVTLQSPTASVAPGDTRQELVYRVTNSGNGPEAFLLTPTSTLTGDQFDPVPAVPAIYFDTDNSGDLSAADTPYVAGSNDPLLQPDAFVTVLVVNDIPTGLASGNRGRSQLTSAARTGTGVPGAVFAGQGVSGTDAVVGTTGADADAIGEYVVSGVSVSAVKSQSVTDPFGSNRPLPGARIIYQIVVAATGTGTANGAAFTDAIPANTSFVAGSIELNGTALTDAADSDVGAYTATPVPQISVQLGNLTQASGPQTIRFAVTIN
ncbi:MAG: hypothetical protein KDI32_03480 [Pseudomonadales bacterium]|nr:hypothetical protein [Pseudomonadales bacterium]